MPTTSVAAETLDTDSAGTDPSAPGEPPDASIGCTTGVESSVGLSDGDKPPLPPLTLLSPTLAAPGGADVASKDAPPRCLVAGPDESVDAPAPEESDAPVDNEPAPGELDEPCAEVSEEPVGEEAEPMLFGDPDDKAPDPDEMLVGSEPLTPLVEPDTDVLAPPDADTLDDDPPDDDDPLDVVDPPDADDVPDNPDDAEPPEAVAPPDGEDELDVPAGNADEPADEDELDDEEPLAPAEPVVSAKATAGVEATAPPTPNATASAATRPMYRA
ncbi:MAG TPA: hypothetical protein VFB19_17190 [Mycobacterium sp.]|nr:hypothetical protein [Mycobacterium sp.]